MSHTLIWSFAVLLVWCHVAVLGAAWMLAMARQPRKLVIAHWVSLMGHLVPIAGGSLVILLLVAVLGLPAIFAAPLALVPLGLIAALRFELHLLDALGRRGNEVTALVTVLLAMAAVILT